MVPVGITLQLQFMAEGQDLIFLRRFGTGGRELSSLSLKILNSFAELSGCGWKEMGISQKLHG
ncbi:hypothetical protein [Ruminococcus albus]|uniref:hypothetical protein n=1 Tax=Ruminococcus albus TaxID=1264 RepID=UPI001D147E53|nr:hypothetical protein [Ruminococcus albus]MCC3352872.1 hypothetical protein [Ruminococcus albus 8]